VSRFFLWARTRRSASLPNDLVGPSFTLALRWQRGATKQALLRTTHPVFGCGYAALGAMQACYSVSGGWLGLRRVGARLRPYQLPGRRPHERLLIRRFIFLVTARW